MRLLDGRGLKCRKWLAWGWGQPLGREELQAVPGGPLPPPRTHRPLPHPPRDCASSLPTPRAALENCPRVKRDFLPADITLAEPSLIFPFQNECCSFHFLK